MTSTINRSVPATNSPLQSASVRSNFVAAANDIEALQAEIGNSVEGPSSSVAGHIATFADTTGKVLEDGGAFLNTVEDGSTVVSHPTILKFSGASVTESPSGTALVTITAAGSLVLVETHTVSTGAAIAFTTGITSSYDDYLLEMIGIIPTTNNDPLLIEVSVDGGANWDTTSGHYVSNYLYNAIGGSVTTYNGGPSTSMTLSAGLGADAANQSYNGKLKFYNPGSAVLSKPFQSEATSWSANTLYFNNMFGAYIQAAAINAVRLRCGTSTITGTGRLYGYAKS